MSTTAKRYLVKTGIDYKTPKGEKRAEAGTVVSDIPKTSLPWLLEQGIVEETTDRVVEEVTE